MFTPKRQWTALSVPEKSWTDSKIQTFRNEKAVAFVDDPPPPPTGLLIDDGSVGYGENLEDWKKFREAGLLDKAAVEERDREVVMNSIQRLERELLDYQHNMGLLLIEKNEWTSQHEELQKSLQETYEILKREKAANLVAISQAEERKSNLRNALDAEKRSVAELGSTLRELHLELEKFRMESEANLAEVNEMAGDIQERSAEVQKRLLEADAKLAEANKKSVELEWKLQEVETRENVLKTERLSFNSERDAERSTFLKHKQDMQEWERKLQEREERLCQNRRHFNDRDDKVTEFESKLKEKENELVAQQNAVELTNLALKKQDSEVTQKLLELSEQQEKADSIRTNLEIKEKDLTSLAERLSAREQMELQVILDEYQSVLDAKEQEYEVRMEEKRKLLLEEYQNKLDDVDRKITELDHKEKMLEKQDEAVAKKLERVKVKDKDVQSMLKGLKDKEKALNLEVKNLGYVNNEVVSEGENVQTLKDEIENLKFEISQKQMQISSETKKVWIADEERKEHIRLFDDLNQELERYRHQRYLLYKESDKMKEDRNKFEEEWMALDEKRDELSRDSQHLEEEKKMIEILKMGAGKETNADEHAKRELEFLRLSKESFEVSRRHEQSLLLEKARLEQEKLLNEFEDRRRELEAGMQKKKEEMGRYLEEREAALEKTIEMENKNNRHLKEVLQKEIENIRSERSILKLEKQKTVTNKRQVEVQQAEMHEDVNELRVLCQKLKTQRQEFIREKHNFLSVTEALRNCQNCDMVSKGCILPELDASKVDDELPLGVELLEKVASYEENTKRTPGDSELKSPGSGARISWFLRKFTFGMLPLSPNNKSQDLPSPSIDEALSQTVRNVGEVSVRSETSLLEDSADQDFRVHEALENPSFPHLKSHPRRHISRTSSMKGVVVDAEAFLNGKLGDLKEPPTSINMKSNGDSPIAGKAARVYKRQSRTQSVVMTDAGEPYEGTTDEGRRKKRQKVPPSPDIAVKQHYNLRQRKTEGKGRAAPVDNGGMIDGQIDDAALVQEVSAGKASSDHRNDNSVTGS